MKRRNRHYARTPANEAEEHHRRMGRWEAIGNELRGLQVSPLDPRPLPSRLRDVAASVTSYRDARDGRTARPAVYEAEVAAFERLLDELEEQFDQEFPP